MNQAAVQVPENPRAAAARREDLYTGIHKALRALLCDALVAVGRMDCDDEREVQAAISRVRQVIRLTRYHLHHENQHVHPALEARSRGAARAAAREHTEHEAAFERLAALSLEVERGSGAAREAAALALYRELALFAAEDFRHMHDEETGLNAALWQHFSDEELKRIHHGIVSTVAPEIMAEYLRWLVPAMTPAERAEFLAEMRQAAPAEAYAGALQIAHAALDEPAWAKLIGALGLRPLPV